MLTILHTADLHLGHVSRQLDAETAKRLARARLGAVDTILGLAQQYDVGAILCAGLIASQRAFAYLANSGNIAVPRRVVI